MSVIIYSFDAGPVDTTLKYQNWHVTSPEQVK
jgi:hypothetical protein